MKFLLLACLLMNSASAFATSSVGGSIDAQNKELYITVLDDPSSTPYDAASIWNSLVGTDSDKSIKTEHVEITCKTLFTQPQQDRFGSCQITVANVQDLSDSFGVLVSGAEAKEILQLFVGRENPDFVRDVNLELAGRKLWVTASHTRGLFAVRISKSLVR